MDNDAIRQSPNATLKESAQFLKISPRTVQNYQARGLLKVVYLGKRRFFRWTELEKLARLGT
jgi:predicted site-specific integrase-resolvase